jgi:hypothetical protein
MSIVTRTDRCELCGFPTGREGSGQEHTYKIARFDRPTNCYSVVPSLLFRRAIEGGQLQARDMSACASHHAYRVCHSGYFVVLMEEDGSVPVFVWDHNGNQVKQFGELEIPAGQGSEQTTG